MDAAPLAIVETPAQVAVRDERINQLERRMVAELPPVECTVEHIFTPGLYQRRITMPAGALITSKIHRTEHPFVITKGKVSVWTDDDGELLLLAGHHGITKPGTRRVLYIHEETVWTTYHPTVETDLEKIEAAIIEPHLIPAFPVKQEAIACPG